MYGLNIKKRIVISLILFPFYSEAGELSPVALYQRCYAHITQSAPMPNSPVLAQIISGTINPLDACIQTLNSALLNSNMMLSNTSDPIRVSVLNNFQKIHGGWFMNRKLPDLDTFLINQTSQGMYDASSLALFYTRALLDPTVDITYVLTAPQTLKAVRSAGPSSVSLLGHPRSEFIFKDSSNFAFPDTGQLWGMKLAGNQSYSYTYCVNGGSTCPSGTLNVDNRFGTGVIGSPIYLLSSVLEPARPTAFRADGALVMPRKWARSVFNDLLCRSLPAVQSADVLPAYVLTNENAAPFRTSASCTQCHVSMDRMAGVIRNFSYELHSFFQDVPKRGGYHVTKTPARPTSTTLDDGWTDVATTNFNERPTRGTFYFRDHKGSLWDRSIGGVNDLNNVIAETEDYYICVAKRYYSHFIGVDVDISDLTGRPALSTIDQKHRSQVIQIGRNLKTHKDPRKTIREIMELSNYSKSDSINNK